MPQREVSTNNIIQLLRGFRVVLERAFDLNDLREPHDINTAIRLLREYNNIIPENQRVFMPVIERYLENLNLDTELSLIDGLNQILNFFENNNIQNVNQINNIDLDNNIRNINIINENNIIINNINRNNINTQNADILNIGTDFNILNFYNNTYINDTNFNNIIHIQNIDLDPINNINYEADAIETTVGIHNQTVHESATEATIQEAITKLRSRYKGCEKIFTNLQQVLLFLRQKSYDLVLSKKLSEDEIKIIEVNFNNVSLLMLEQRSQAVDLLRLAISALNDKAIAQQMCDRDPEDVEQLADDMLSRWAGWFRSAIIDSQLAYRRDRGDMSIPCNDEELSKDRSCFGGSLNRIIYALNLIHPDVAIQEGQQTLANMERYRQDREIATIKKFGQNKLHTRTNDYLDDYLVTIDLKNLKDILSKLEKIDEKELDSDHKNESLISFEKDLEAHIVTDASLYLGIENFTLIQRELQPFISAYIDGILGDRVKEAIGQKERIAAKRISI